MGIIKEIVTVSITVERYRTADGRPTCRVDAQHQCMFLMLQYGLIPICTFGQNKKLETYNDDLEESLRPDCKVWE